MNMRKKLLLKCSFLLLMMVALVLLVIFLFGTGDGRTGEKSFFEQFVKSGGPIVWFVLMPISMVAVYLVFEHSMTIRRSRLLPVGIADEIISSIEGGGLKKLKDEMDDNEDFVSIAVLKAVSSSKADWFRMRSVLDESLQEQALVLLRRIEWISLIGNVSPMVGLFGTVFGMIKLFNAVVISGGQPSPVQLADGISVALVTTFWGLFIAIPALAIHGVFRNRIETLVNEAVAEADDIIAAIRKIAQKKV